MREKPPTDWSLWRRTKSVSSASCQHWPQSYVNILWADTLSEIKQAEQISSTFSIVSQTPLFSSSTMCEMQARTKFLTLCIPCMLHSLLPLKYIPCSRVCRQLLYPCISFASFLLSIPPVYQPLVTCLCTKPWSCLPPSEDVFNSVNRYLLWFPTTSLFCISALKHQH